MMKHRGAQRGPGKRCPLLAPSLPVPCAWHFEALDPGVKATSPRVGSDRPFPVPSPITSWLWAQDVAAQLPTPNDCPVGCPQAEFGVNFLHLAFLGALRDREKMQKPRTQPGTMHLLPRTVPGAEPHRSSQRHSRAPQLPWGSAAARGKTRCSQGADPAQSAN